VTVRGLTGGRLFDALVDGRIFIGKALTGFFGTLFWLGAPASAA